MSLIDDDDLNVLRGKKGKVTQIKKEDAAEKKVTIAEETDVLSEDELVTLNKKTGITRDVYHEFTDELYPYSLNFYDFEVFKYDWMVVIINPVSKIKTVIVNDRKALIRYYNEHKDEIWVGYNSHNYDTYILKSILLGMNPKRTNDLLIVGKLKGWQISEEFRDKQLYDFDICSTGSLKQLEGFMGNDIRETTVPFDLDRKLTFQEVKETIKYCIHDVEQTIEVFKRRKNEYDAQMDLINTFELKLSMVSLTQAQLTANILGCKAKGHDDEFDLKFVDTLRISKYKDVVEWFKNPANMNYQSSMSTMVCGIPHQFGWGGIHGCPEKPLHAEGRIFHCDVTSYYPSMMIEYGLLTRNCKNPKKFKQIYDKRVELKKAGKKKEQQPYKIILNSTYGICKDKYSGAYDPLQANNVCVNGQLMLLDLLEHLEGYATIIQSNTDGIILQVEDNDEAENKMKEICQEWMDRTGMGLGFDEITEIFQGDVNNYLFKFKNGKLERKGAYVKELSELDYDLPIVNKAIVRYLTDGIEPSETINGCNKLIEYQKIVKVSSSYLYGWHNGEFLTDKTFRVFASKNVNDTYVGKCKSEGATIEKFANTPQNCFIVNAKVTDELVPDWLDKKWYIDLAEQRINEKFGIKVREEGLGLF